MSNNLLEAYRLAVPIPEVFLIPDFITEAEESYLSEKIDEVGNSNIVFQPNGSSSLRAGGWQRVKQRRSMHWGGTLTAKGRLIPRALPPFMTQQWPNVFERISKLGIFNDFESPDDKLIRPNHCLVNEYIGAEADGILPHQDGPAYLPIVATLSLESHTIYDFHSYLDDDSITSQSLTTSSLAVPSLVVQPTSDDPICSSDISKGRTISPDPIFSIFVPRRSLIILRSRCYTDLLHAIPNRRFDGLYTDLSRCLNWKPEAVLCCSLSDSSEPQLERTRRVSLTCRRVKKVITGLSKFVK
ncbi:uncharacterized protein MELLADRAFT_92555 [Melampsora larici-populina 98AG31]|uniref:Fe2OG dioxygenase domain-containing protein n=1 Tax=Melampsora larici-populina (strain 98AG31 / pathotype 3-4-7) TaxID=747676 RepID=F4S1Z1_MELLP|nr:uncharacterized protein MELLADRAFT_92555 [Melampsora larici-populina 98AG31]EGG01356.1 hypothetical protein MELLADRAFT_92555 [Melampsora larici-populina 98AG31]